MRNSSRLLNAAISLFALFTASMVTAVEEDERYQVELIADGFGIPWGLEIIDDKQIIVTEKSGAIWQLHLTSGKKTKLFEFKDLYQRGQGGLLDVARSPSNPQQYYFTYSKPVPDGGTVALAVAELHQNQLKDWRELFVADATTTSSRHFGSRITFDDQGHLFFGIGDRGERDNGQDTTNHAATILRFNLDGTLPKDNPYRQDPKVRDEIWSFGHRNPQGLLFDQSTQRLWEIEHGPRGGDEINLIQPKRNYGWPITSHGKEYWGPVAVGDAKEMDGIESPKLVYVPSIAPGSLVLYRGDKYPELDGKLLAGALKLEHINVVSITEDRPVSLNEEKRIVGQLDERIRDIIQGKDNYLYFSTDDGNVYRLLPLQR